MSKVTNFAIVYISVITLIFSQSMPVFAGIIGTDQIMAQQYADQQRESLHEIINRNTVQKLLEQNGVSAEQAQERIQAMTDEEVRILAQKFEDHPAAGGIGTAAAVLILILLIIVLALGR